MGDMLEGGRDPCLTPAGFTFCGDCHKQLAVESSPLNVGKNGMCRHLLGRGAGG